MLALTATREVHLTRGGQFRTDFRTSVHRTCTKPLFLYAVRSTKHPSNILYGFQMNGTSILVRTLIYRTTKFCVITQRKTFSHNHSIQLFCSPVCLLSVGFLNFLLRQMVCAPARFTSSLFYSAHSMYSFKRGLCNLDVDSG